MREKLAAQPGRVERVHERRAPRWQQSWGDDVERGHCVRGRATQRRVCDAEKMARMRVSDPELLDVVDTVATLDEARQTLDGFGQMLGPVKVRIEEDLGIHRFRSMQAARDLHATTQDRSGERLSLLTLLRSPRSSIV